MVQIICDQHYRTYAGLKVLVQKEWNYYQYDFQSKSRILQNIETTQQEESHGFSALFGGGKEQSVTEVDPCFLLFMDSLH